jgi:TolA-binding protein
MAAYRRGDCNSAKAAFNRVVAGGGPDTPSALHHLARCEKRSGQCGRAIPHYEKVINRYPSYAGRPDALYEAAKCRRRLGHLSAARSLLEELSRIPGWEDRARESLEDL